MERIAGILCSHNRTIFAEVSAKVLAPLLSRMMCLQNTMLKEFVQKFPRVGILMEPLGDEIEITLAWINGNMTDRKWSQRWRDKLVDVGSWKAHLNTNEPYRYQSPNAMQAAAFHSRDAKFGIQVYQELGLPKDEAVQMAWMTHRLMSLSGTSDHEAKGWDGMLRTISVSAAIGLGAILLIEAPELKRQRREKVASETKKRSEATSTEEFSVEDERPEEGRLSIVTLRLTDPELQREYQTLTQIERGKRRSTAKHLVRGHVFATRWGGIAWRRPHWRGDANKKILHRVV
ncbi:hypothetical protein [Ruegeria conchae]|uniref:hypothetical protein n=1 Tax=Ruegeria conchae TaxID=981384 RepID=UPI0029C60FEE|nr:hypothetical protein [Ruegeria conchae]